MNYTLASILAVFLGLSEPKDWPPLFGDISKVTTVRYFWGTYWQQLLRTMFTGWGNGLARLLGLPPHTNISSYFKLYVAFAISGLFHALMTYTMPSTAQHTFDDRFLLVFKGFFIQAFIVHIEDIILWAYRKLTGDTHGERGKTSADKKRKMWKTLLGYIWVTACIWYSLQLVGDGYLKTGITLTSDVPAPFMEKMFHYLTRIMFK
ncbi:hypothetical protein LOZ12_006416 [Ophidiomyces ophidiicola]|nr:hypothetical protein LOZ64_006503 [Ophidiomyces ophidiicola]KAI1909008.1 hypothetical protein LOZ61_005245 [Ophidiomyces ophidiicola]KAI1924309.1 hypothetical protein LOZ60_004770 [Ophidiomyces ophidiicola]KAI1935840.1 hypothetical protein LOZ62_005842 [Ophidiomyces ophidiicola]KAI1954370.1 hypothetical protein LOZ59_004974 [Ophidiomyces ophidiicola]